MFSIIGIVVVFGCILAGYLMEHGNVKVLMQPAELIIIDGAALGTVLISNPVHTLKQMISGLLGVFGPSKYSAESERARVTGAAGRAIEECSQPSLHRGAHRLGTFYQQGQLWQLGAIVGPEKRGAAPEAAIGPASRSGDTSAGLCRPTTA
jgi:hypothetical protein